MFERSIDLLNNPRYLGNYKVVDGLVRDYVANVMNADTENDIFVASGKMANIFAGLDANYIQVDGWCDRFKLGAHLEQFMNVDGEQSFYDSVRTAFVLFAQQLMQALMQGGGDTPEVRAAVDGLIKKFVGILMGAGPMVAHG